MSDELDVLRDELKLLKDEQRDRIRARDNLIYSVIVASAAIVGAARVTGPALPLLLPLVTLVLGWTYLVNDHKVTAIGRYLSTDLGPRLSTASGGEALRWETHHRSDRARRQRKCLQLAVDLMVFVLPGAAALLWYWTAGPAPALLLAVSIIEAAAIVTPATCRPEVTCPLPPSPAPPPTSSGSSTAAWAPARSAAATTSTR